MFRSLMLGVWLYLGTPWAAPAHEPSERHVVIISVDGLPAYLIGDPKVPMPTIRGLAQEGAVADGMKVSNPSVTWPNHTTMATGVRPDKHSVLFNGVLVRPGPGLPVHVDPRKTKEELVRAETLYDAAHAAGLRTADVNWPCTRGCAALDDSFPDVPDGVAYMTPRFRSLLLSEGILADATDKAFKATSPVARDDAWTRAASSVIRERRPNKLLFHLLNVDATHHKEGPQSPAGYTAVAYADTCVRRVLDALGETGMRDDTTVFIVSDHGFMPTPRTLLPNVLLRQHGLLQVGLPGVVAAARVHVFPEGGIGMVYITDAENRDEHKEAVRRLFRDQEGIADIIEPDRYAEYGLPPAEVNPQVPELILAARDGYGFSGSPDGDEFVVPSVAKGFALGQHGYLSTNPRMNAVFIASGRGVRGGVRLGVIENVDVAPTVAHLLGLRLENADGVVRREILTEP